MHDGCRANGSAAEDVSEYRQLSEVAECWREPLRRRQYLRERGAIDITAAENDRDLVGE